jgi:hypothetical protein
MEQELPPTDAAPRPARLDPDLRFAVTPYESDGGCPAGGLLLLILWVLGSASASAGWRATSGNGSTSTVGAAIPVPM